MAAPITISVTDEKFEWQPGEPIHRRPALAFERDQMFKLKEDHRCEAGCARDRWALVIDMGSNPYDAGFRWRPTQENEGRLEP